MAKNSEKSTHENGKKLREIRESVNYDLRSFAKCIGIPERTLQDYEYGKRKTPVEVVNAALSFRARDRKLTASIIKRAKKEIDRQFPNGILSEVDSDFLD